MKFLRLFKFKLALTFLVLVSCKTTNQNEIKELKPLITNIYTADPSAHIFNDKIYIYPSHDVDEGDAFDDLGSHFAMKDIMFFQWMILILMLLITVLHLM